MGDSRIKDVSTLLTSFFNEETVRHGERFSEVFRAWPSLVGARLAAHSRVVEIEKGLLIVEAEHPGWIQLLQLRQSNILEDAARRYPELGLRGVAFKLSGQLGMPSKKDEAEAEPDTAAQPLGQEPDPRVEDAQAQALERIADPDFRALLKGLKDSLRGEP